MAQLQRWLAHGIGLAAVAVMVTWPDKSAVAVSAPTFTQLCEAFQGTPNDGSSFLYSRPYAWETVDALMSALALNDCALAAQKLRWVQDLRGPQLQTTYLPENALMADFPMGVDLEVIAIATPNLVALNLSGRVIQDLAPIASLTSLQTLQLANTQLTDISAVSALSQLQTLDVSYNQLTTIAPVAAVATIRSLNVAYNPFTDVSPLGSILTPATEQEWQLLDLSGIDIDLTTCPETLGDICEGPAAVGG